MNSFIVTAGVISPAVVTLIVLVSVFFVLLLVLLFLSQKVLPNGIVLEESAYSKDGVEINGVRAVVKYTRTGKRGTLVVSTPAAISGPAACKVTFNVVAFDKRIVKSCDRRVRIVGIVSNSDKVIVNNNILVKDRATGEFTDRIIGKGSFVEFVTMISTIEIVNERADLNCTINVQ